MRIKFIQDTPRYGKNACIILPDDQAKEAIDAGHAIKIPDIQSVGAANDKKPEPSRRVIFDKNFSTSEKTYFKGARETVPASVAAKAIKAGAARDLPVQSVDDAGSKMASGENKAMTPVATK